MFDRELWDKKARIALINYLKNHTEVVATIPQFINDGQAFWQNEIQSKFVKTSSTTIEDIVTAMSLDDVCRQDGNYTFVYILFEDIINDNFDEPFIADVDNTIDRNFTVTFNEQGDIQEIN